MSEFKHGILFVVCPYCGEETSMSTNYSSWTKEDFDGDTCECCGKIYKSDVEISITIYKI